MLKSKKLEEEIKKLEEEIKQSKNKLIGLKRFRSKEIRKNELETFRFKFSLDIDLRSDQIWPDDNHPLNPSVDDVWCVISDEVDILKKWNLIGFDDNLLTITKRRTKKRSGK